MYYLIEAYDRITEKLVYEIELSQHDVDSIIEQASIPAAAIESYGCWPLEYNEVKSLFADVKNDADFFLTPRSDEY